MAAALASPYQPLGYASTDAQLAATQRQKVAETEFENGSRP